MGDVVGKAGSEVVGDVVDCGTSVVAAVDEVVWLVEQCCVLRCWKCA